MAAAVPLEQKDNAVVMYVVITRGQIFLRDAVKDNDGVTRTQLIAAIRGFPNSWQMKFAEALAGETDPKNLAVKLRNGAPFLSSPTKDDLTPRSTTERQGWKHETLCSRNPL